MTPCTAGVGEIGHPQHNTLNFVSRISLGLISSRDYLPFFIRIETEMLLAAAPGGGREREAGRGGQQTGPETASRGARGGGD